MITKRFRLAGLVLTACMIGLIPGKLSSPDSLGFAAARSGGAADEVPPYHTSSPSAKKLPATLDPEQFPDAITKNAYAMAAKVKTVLYQQPCYCHCDKELGHASLLDCFTSTHAAVCNVCKWEGIYAYNEHMKKRTAEQIREGILKGEYRKVDLSQYKEYKPSDGR